MICSAANSMTSLKQQLQTALRDAMRNKDHARRNAIRLLNSAIKQVEIDTRGELDDAAVLDILQKEAKKLRETVAELEAAGRNDDAESGRFELEVVEAFLPKQLDTETLRPIVQAAIDEVGDHSPKAMGQVMRIVMPQVRGRADGKQVNAIVRELLS